MVNTANGRAQGVYRTGRAGPTRAERLELEAEYVYSRRDTDMRNREGLMAELLLTDGTVVLWLALALAVIFLALLVLDRVVRSKRRRRGSHHHARRRKASGDLFSRMRALQGEFKQLYRELSRRKRGRGRRPPGTLR